MKMESKSKLSTLPIQDLLLDASNPRFAELYSGSDSEEDLIEYLLYTEAAEEIAKGIVSVNEFYPDEPLWVLKRGEKYLVKDGNRRCAAAKALQMPSKYQLGTDKFELSSLPVLIFEDEDYLAQRVREKHAHSLFREWERIAKALQIHALYDSGSSIDSMKDMDSRPTELIKLASFYYEAVKIGGENLKQLLRRGRGNTRGRTIIFERLFKHSKLCGYSFKGNPSYEINILDKDIFSEYISAMVQCLEQDPQISHKTVDEEGEDFLKRLGKFGFSRTSQGPSGGNPPSTQIVKGLAKKTGVSLPTPTPPKKSGSVQNRPAYERKSVPSTLHQLIKECYDLDSNNFSNAKTALTRVTFECTLKYVLENTQYNSVTMADANIFKRAFFFKNGMQRPFVDFQALKDIFTQLIRNTGKKRAFEDFDLERSHQIIHNYNVCATSHDAQALCANLTPLIEFMLQAEQDLLNCLETAKL